MLPILNAMTTLYLFRLNNVGLDKAFTNLNSEDTLETLLNNTTDKHLVIECYEFRTIDDRLSIRLPYNEAIKYNYCVVRNLDKPLGSVDSLFFCYIKDYTANNISVTTITLELDTITTYYPQIKENGLKGLLDRAHVPQIMTRVYGENNENKLNVINPELFFAEDEVDTYEVLNTYFNNNVIFTSSIALVFNLPNGWWKYDDGFPHHDNIYINNPSYGEPTTRGFIQSSNLCCLIFCSQRPNVVPSSPYLTAQEFLEQNNEWAQYLVRTCLLPYGFTPLDYDRDHDFPNRVHNKLQETDYNFSILQTFDGSTKSNIGMFISNHIALRHTYRNEDLTTNIVDYINNNLYSDFNNIDITRDINREPKLYLFPYMYSEYKVQNFKLVLKYQDIDYMNLLLSWENEYLETFISQYRSIVIAIDILSNTPTIYGDYVYSKYFIKSNSVNFYSYNPTDIYYDYYLPSTSRTDAYNFSSTNLISFQYNVEQYTLYNQYEKAIVDANLKNQARVTANNTISNTISSAFAVFGMLGSFYTGSVGGFVGSGITATKQMGETVNQWFNYANAVEVTKLRESALKEKPPTTMSENTFGNALGYLYNSYNSTGINKEHFEYTLIYSISNIMRRAYYNKFYLYGYYIPLNFDTKVNEDLFEYIFNSRNQFNFVKFNNVYVYSNEIAIPFINNIQDRLIQGVTFYHINSVFNIDLNKENMQMKEYNKPLLLTINEENNV